MEMYTFQCSACGHRFTAYGGPMPVLLAIGLISASILVSVFKWPLRAGDTVSVVAGALIGGFCFYKVLLWKLNPAVH